MSLPDNSSPRDAVGVEGNSSDPYRNIADNVLRFTSGRFERMFWFDNVGCQHRDTPMQAAPTINIPLGQENLNDERTALSFSSMPSSSSSASQSGEPYLMQPTYTAEQGAYACHDLPVVSDFHQGFVGDGSEDHVYCSPPSFGGQWHIKVPVDNALANGEQDAISCWEPSSAASHHPPLPEGSDMMEIMPTGHTTQSGGPRVFRCQHHARGGPCGLLIEGDIQDALEHFARVHVHRPRPIVTKSSSPADVWTCRWGGKCNISMLKDNFRRHVTGHLVRWQCLNCPRNYSRDDSARKHAKNCGGDGSIIMVPRSDDRPHKRRKRTSGKGKRG